MTASLQLFQQHSHLPEEGMGWVTARGYNPYVLGGCLNLVPTAMMKTMTKRATRGGKGFYQPTVIRRRSQGMGTRQELGGRNGSRDCRGGTLLTDLLSLLSLTTQDHFAQEWHPLPSVFTVNQEDAPTDWGQSEGDILSLEALLPGTC